MSWSLIKIVYHGGFTCVLLFQVKLKGAKVVGPTPRHYRLAKQMAEAVHLQTAKPTALSQTLKVVPALQEEGRGKVGGRGET